MELLPSLSFLQAVTEFISKAKKKGKQNVV